MPVFALGTLIGVLTVYSPRREPLSDEESRAVAGVAHEIATLFAQLTDDRWPWDPVGAAIAPTNAQPAALAPMRFGATRTS
jgi:hypothetical protein